MTSLSLAHQHTPTKGHAAGGYAPPGWGIWGEQGPELVRTATATQTIPHAQSMAYLAGGGNRTITVIVKDTSGRTLRQEAINDALGRGVSEATVRAAYP